MFGFGKPKRDNRVGELGALVQAGGEQIAHELTELHRGQLEISQSVGRLTAATAQNSTDIRDLSKIIGDLKDSIDSTNSLLGRVIQSLPAEQRPTPAPPPPIGAHPRIPRSPPVPRFGRE